MHVHGEPINSCTARILGLVVLLTMASAGEPALAQLSISGFSYFEGRAGSMAGFAVATGDFNGDGFDDLAVGNPAEESSGKPDAGSVTLFLGGHGDWSAVVTLTPGSFGLESETDARFGSALTFGDFDDDGFDDLAIGVPGSTVNGASAAGQVVVAFGSGPIDGLVRFQLFSQGPLVGVPEANDRFGSALAAGDLSADGVDDLAIGTFLEDLQGEFGLQESTGAVNVVYGFRGVGLTTSNNRLIHEDSPGVGLNANANERFGFSLAIGQFTGNSNLDLAVGAPGEITLGPGAKGAVILFPGGPGGLDPVADQEVFFSQETAGVLGTGGEGDSFGYSLAAGNFDGDLFQDLAIGVPGETELGDTETGAVQILFGGGVGLVTAGNQFFVESTIDSDVDPFDRLGTDLAAGDFDGDGRDDLAIGAPFDNSLGFTNSGEVTVLYGTPNGISIAGLQIFDMIFFGTLEIEDHFGASLAAGRFFSDSQQSQDLVVGIPLRDGGLGADSGASLVIRNQLVFSDGFESGDVGAWTSSTSG